MGRALILALLGLLMAALPALADPIVIGGPAADLIVVEKAARRLTLVRGGQAIASFPIALGFDPTGPKTHEGDGRTPEGRYVIDRRNRDSRYHLSLHISYPDAADERRARAAGYSPGGAIFIHGEPQTAEGKRVAAALGDWTVGCIAVSDVAIERIWSLVDDGTPIDIRP